jgi:hypothetical protein
MEHLSANLEHDPTGEGEAGIRAVAEGRIDQRARGGQLMEPAEAQELHTSADESGVGQAIVGSGSESERAPGRDPWVTVVANELR